MKKKQFEPIVANLKVKQQAFKNILINMWYYA